MAGFRSDSIGGVSSCGTEAPPADRPTRRRPPADTELAAAASVDPTRLIVDFRDDVSAETLANNGFAEIPISDYSATDRLYRIDFSSAAEAAAARTKLAHDPSVESVDFESFARFRRVRTPRSWRPPRGTRSWRTNARRPPRAAASRTTPATSTSGTSASSACPTRGSVATARVSSSRSSTPASRGWPISADTKFVPGYNFLSNNDNAADDHGHGTHVAGTIAQSTNNKVGVAGVAYGASIMPLKVLSARGSGSVAGITQAIRWAADHGANVINMSLGGPTKMGSMGSRREVRP